MHHVPLRDAAALIRKLSDAGLSSREGCGNTVRNVTADPWAGVCHDELWDPTPYVGAYVRYFVRHPTTQLMPRKVKTAFTGSDTDRALTGIHDIAFIARERDGVRGFEIRIGGGTAIMPRVAPTLVDFVTADDGEYLKWAEAVLRIFDRQDWLRVNRARARIKVLVDKVGIDAVRAMVDEELQGDWVDERDFSIDHRLFVHDEEANAPAPPLGVRLAQRRRVGVRALRGSQRRAPAPGRLLGRPGEGGARRPDARAVPRPRRRSCASTAPATRARPCTRTSCCAGCATRRSTTSGSGCAELGLGDAGSDEINDVVSCPGTDSCKLGITSSMGLNRAVQERIEAMDITDPLTRRIHIKMSGCPNGCSQHHIGNIGFYGASIKVGENTIPAYVAHIGGNYEGGEIVYGARLKVRLPAKRVPEAVERWLRKYEAERIDGEVFNAFAERVGTTGVRGRGPRPRDAGGVRPGDDEPLHRLDEEGPVPGHPRRRRVRRLIGAVPTKVAGVNRRPRLRLEGSSASPEEAAAVIAAVEQFLRDTLPPAAPPEPAPDPWLRAARLEARRARRPTRRRGSPGPRPRRRARRGLARATRSSACAPRSPHHHAGEWTMPAKVYLEAPPHGDFRAMPALGGGFAMLKWISSFPGNPARHGLPTVMGVVCLSDAATSAPRMLLDARAVTALRTGAVAAVAARALARAGAADGRRDRLRPARRVGGALPGRRRLRPGRLRRPAAGGGRRRWPHELGWRAGDRADALACDVVCCVTPGHEPVVDVGDLRPGPAPQHARRRRPGQGGGDASTRSRAARCSATSGRRRRTAAS